MKFLIPLIFISLVKYCDSQSLNIYDQVIEELEANCFLIQKELRLKEDCLIKLSSKSITINITAFHEIVDSLNLIKKEGMDSFTAANLFDLENHKDSFENEALTKIADKNTNIQLYCSEVIDGLMTCETIEKKGVERNNDLIFGQSLLHLLRISESNDVKLIHSVLINNN